MLRAADPELRYEVLLLGSLNERISSEFRATVISLAQLGIRVSLLSRGSPRGLWNHAWGLPSVLSTLGIPFSIAFVCLLLPLIIREPGPPWS